MTKRRLNAVLFTVPSIDIACSPLTRLVFLKVLLFNAGLAERILFLLFYLFSEMNFKMLSTGILCCSIESLSLIVIELSFKVS